MSMLKNVASFVSQPKLNELESAIINNKHILIQGPPGCGKSYSLIYFFNKHNISHDYIENILSFKISLTNSIILSDLDSKEQIYKFIDHIRTKKSASKQFIIETRCIFQKLEFVEKLSDIFVLINFNKITDIKIKKLVADVSKINGNLHRLKMYNFLEKCKTDNVADFYHFLGKIFYGKMEKIEEVKRGNFSKDKLIDYIRANCMYFLSKRDLFVLLELLSGSEDCDVIIYYILKCDKNKPDSFFSFKSLKECIKLNKKIEYF